MSFGGGGSSGGECWRRRAPRGDPIGFVGRVSFDRIPLMVGLGVMTGGPVALWPPQLDEPDEEVITSAYAGG